MAKQHSTPLRDRLTQEAAAKADPVEVMIALLNMMELARRHIDRLNVTERWQYDTAYQLLHDTADPRLHPDPMTCPKDQTAN